MGKTHSFSIEGTHAPLASELSYKVMSSLRHSIGLNPSYTILSLHLLICCIKVISL